MAFCYFIKLALVLVPDVMQVVTTGMAIVDNAAERILANCGEDGFIELWALSSEHHLSHKQFMRTPAQTAWSIAALNNGDIAVGAKLRCVDEITEYIKANVPEARIASRKKAARMQPRQRVIVDGQEWDYVFDVTTEDGRVLKLPYNVGEDMNWAAQRFVEKYKLPIQFLQKVNCFIRVTILLWSSFFFRG
ncbi:Protein DOA1 [Toxocara canis]|uniref:Protein DOA1 n=1 Tax=Toxocara canis TaxID=6265 RepID=A0A0B2UN02_TOXCA|nr:Protein DOA1 [Toxocara canis]